MRILAVDDDPLILELLTETLPRLGYPDVTGAGSAQEAQAILQEATTPFDCCLLDIQMPGMTGIDLCQWLRQLPGYAQVPVLMITAMSERSFIDQSFAVGATDYVTKPFNPQELSARMQRAEQLNRERQAPQLLAGAAADADATGQDVALHQPFNIAEVRGVMDLLALENYLMQLGRGGMIASACFAFRIAAAPRLHASCSGEEYYYTMADVAEAIAEGLRFYETFLAHAGNGAFVCVAHGHNLPDEDELLTDIRHNIEMMDLRYDDQRPMLVNLLAGPRLRLGLRSGRAALDQLDQALRMTGEATTLPQRARPAPRRSWLFGLFGWAQGLAR